MGKWWTLPLAVIWWMPSFIHGVIENVTGKVLVRVVDTDSGHITGFFFEYPGNLHKSESV